ncbi:uncharacterized protein EI90DRAFT_3288820 [Cantharellus anzutake]|uniref:uncharacterized protein n=1 Tax=Cantharellus anzutake TaxID=1750568 RepID=UPI0019058063|nr:uncharacterized protein EI90DRAFT_3288820 [Cantharellus anzutake]KAF8332575.1 hypothetical protein EI90DRAFT_3288820 [Cantharellus anzutake]
MRVWSAIIMLALLPKVATAHFHVGALTSPYGKRIVITASQADTSCDNVVDNSKGEGENIEEAAPGVINGTVCDHSVTVSVKGWFVGDIWFIASDGTRGYCYLVGQASACTENPGWIWRDNMWCEAPHIC